ncbi:MAG: NUDIX hydrolase [Chloroflexota bacterium]
MSQEQARPRQRYERQVSAGGVVYRMGTDQVEVLLCGRRVPVLWCLPKGTPDRGERVEDTALREVREETGVTASIVGKLGSIRYSFTRVQDNTRCDKTVHHYLMEPVDGDPSLHDHEFDEVRWFPAGEALEVMTYLNEVNILQKAVDVLAGRDTLAVDGSDDLIQLHGPARKPGDV